MKKYFLILMLAALPATAMAADKNWTGEGDGSDWADDANWLAAGKPGASDTAKVDMRDARVEVGQSFETRSLTVGGKKNSTVNISNFVAGSIVPAAETEDAATVRRDGKVIIKGSAGKIKLKGSYKDSEELIAEEPTFMLYVK